MLFKVDGCWVPVPVGLPVPGWLPTMLPQPPPASASARCAGILVRTFVGAGKGQAQAAVAQTLQDLLGVVAEPKQQAQVG